MNFNEENFRAKAEQEISRRRPGDWNHALRVVERAKQLGNGRKDLPLLVSAAHIHDIGWRDVLPKDGFVANLFSPASLTPYPLLDYTVTA